MTQHFTHMFYTSTRYESLMFHLNLTIDIQAKTVVISVEIDAKNCYLYETMFHLYSSHSSVETNATNQPYAFCFSFAIYK